MGSRYLTDLGHVARNAGLVVREEPGWQTRARSSGGYANGLPNHVMIHHTASPPSSNGQKDVNYICYNSPDKPIANLYIDRQGVVWICAAGATNTNGKGRDRWGGGVPENRMNEYAISIEAANTGTGEPWPVVQQDALVWLTAALVKHYGIPVGHVRAHFEWAPDRKIDPAGQSRYAAGANKWNMDQFRSDVLLFNPNPIPPDPPPVVVPPTPIPGVPDVFHPIHPFRNSDTRGFGGPGVAAGTPHKFGLNRNVFPANVTAVALNVAVVEAKGPGFVTVWPDGSIPDTSIINYPAGGAHNGATIVGIADFAFMIQTSQVAHLICDVTGYWTS